jgi:hypothetical protein
VSAYGVHAHQVVRSRLNKSLAALVAAASLVAAISCSNDDIGSSLHILDHIVVAPADTTVFAGSVIHFTAAGKDAGGNDVALSPIWYVPAGNGTITADGVFTAGSTPGTFTNFINASSGAIVGSTSLTIEAPPP